MDKILKALKESKINVNKVRKYLNRNKINEEITKKQYLGLLKAIVKNAPKDLKLSIGNSVYLGTYLSRGNSFIEDSLERIQAIVDQYADAKVRAWKGNPEKLILDIKSIKNLPTNEKKGDFADGTDLVKYILSTYHDTYRESSGADRPGEHEYYGQGLKAAENLVEDEGVEEPVLEELIEKMKANPKAYWTVTHDWNDTGDWYGPTVGTLDEVVDALQLNRMSLVYDLLVEDLGVTKQDVDDGLIPLFTDNEEIPEFYDLFDKYGIDEDEFWHKIF